MNNSNLALTNNIQSIGVNTAYNVIYNFMEKKKKSSINTYNNYVRYYNEFFSFICGKDLWSVTWEDILQITYTQVEDYQVYMLNEKKWSPNYCNQRLFAVKSLWQRLHAHNNQVNIDVLEFDELDIEEVNYASLTREEVDLLIDFAKEQSKGNIQSMVFEFLFVVACRKEVPFKLKKSDITRNYDFTAQKDVWVLNYKDKGKVIQKAISDEFYEKICGIMLNGKDKVFNVCSKTIENTFKKFQAKYNLYKRNGEDIVIHSIKKASGWSVYQSSGGDLKVTQDHCQHEHVDLTAKTYLRNNYCSQGSYMLSEDITIDDLSGMTQGQLLKIINTCGQDIINRFYFEGVKCNYISEK